MRMATRSVIRLYDQALAPVGLRQTGYAVLSRLAEEGPLAVSELATRLAMDRTTCTRELVPLLAAGWVESTPGEDRRRREVGLTSAGKAKRAEAYPRWLQVQDEVAAAFGPAEVSGLLEEVHRLRSALSALTEQARSAEGDES
jgi:DNA-binding MarR family transcriptional regulator